MAGSRVPDVVNAAVDALAGDTALGTLLGGSKAYTNVPKGTDPPYVMVLGGDESPWAASFECEAGSPLTSDSGDSGGRVVDVLVQCVSTFRGSAQVDDIASRVMDVLIAQQTWLYVSGFQIAQLVRNAAQFPQDIFGDGEVWFQRQVTIRVTVF